MPVRHFVVEVDGLTLILLAQPPIDDRAVLWWDIKASPTNPYEVEVLLAPAECGDEATRRHLERVLAIRTFRDRDWQAVGHDD